MENKLPEGWKWKKLGDLTEKFVSGGTPPTKNESYWNGTIPWTTSARITSRFIDSSEKYITDDAVINSATNIVPKNNVLIATRVGIGKSAVNLIDLAISQDLTGVILNKSLILPAFLVIYLHSPKLKQNFELSARGSTIRGLTRSDVENIKVPLPPLETQQKIVSVLEKAEETKKLRAQADELTQQLLQSMFLEMFGDPVTNSKNWDVEKVQDVISSIEAGWSANGEQKPREENEYAVLKVSAVTQGVFLPEECKVINNDIEFKKVVTPEKGDVLFSRANTLELVGASCLIREDYPYLLLPDKLWKIKVNKEKIYPEYLKFVLSYPTIRSEISKLSTGTSGSMYNISMNKLKLIGITVPPIEIQKNFSIIVETIEKTKEIQKQSSLEINNLFDALMQKAFTGELVS